ncbi:MAG TPA: hypothetical protein DDW20_00635, partial [Firmicutes bacterium]|nr:hypothetical protein [Bacillota bacterium]
QISHNQNYNPNFQSLYKSTFCSEISKSFGYYEPILECSFKNFTSFFASSFFATKTPLKLHY